jgi:selenocysteine lyase/cysteine desulfurase
VLDTGLTYLDTGSLGPALRVAMVAEYRARENANFDPIAYWQTRLSSQSINALLTRLGAFVGCAADEIALTSGATEALNLVSNGLDLAPGDEILTTSHEHPAALYAWLLQAQRKGIVVNQVPLPSPLTGPEQPLGLIAAQVTPRTRVLAFSHIQYTDGAMLPVKELCAFARQRNIVSVVDGAQALGAAQLSLHEFGCDFYAASLHKWLAAPYGMGLLYVRREMLNAVAPLWVDTPTGWRDKDRFDRASSDDDARATWPATLRKLGSGFRYQGPLLNALEATLDIHERIGRERIEARVRELAIYARLRLQQLHGVELLTPSHPSMWNGIMSLRPRTTTSAALANALLRDNRVATRAIAHPDIGLDALRICLHIFNSHDDVERLLQALSRQLRG